jgi:periplasmic copper chaperone A
MYFIDEDEGLMRKVFAAAVLGLASMHGYADVSIKAPWVRATAPAQKVAGGYMQISSTTNARLLKLTSPLASSVELHASSMENGVMKMRYLEQLEIPAGKVIEFKPGSYHIMLIGLKKQLVEGDKVPLKLLFADNSNKEHLFEVSFPVQADAHEKHEHMHH